MTNKLSTKKGLNKSSLT